jgi:nickel-dependent lactate racemase
MSLLRLLRGGFLYQHFRVHLHTTTATGVSVFRPTCSRLSEIISELTLTRGLISRGVHSSTHNGQRHNHMLSRIIGKGMEHGFLSKGEIQTYTQEALSEARLSDKSVLVIIPDLTRSAPIPLFFRLIDENIGEQVKRLDYLIALGTHQPVDEEQFCQIVGVSIHEWKSTYKNIRYFNHVYDRMDELVEVGKLTEEEVFEISGGLMREEVSITLNKRVFDYDILIILSPVVPHETAGFSGGNKYLFPGIAGADVIAFFHWLGAVITNPMINGTKENPVRAILDNAASYLNIPCLCFNMVVQDKKISGLFIGDVKESWSRAADLSAKVHIVYLEKPYKKVLGLAPEYYTEIWVAGKVMYKLEPIVADGGELIIYGSHVAELSFTFKPIIKRIGYHVRDYFLKQMDRFSDVPRGVLAHSTNVRGVGTFENGIERPRIQVTLATAIPEAVCKKINLGYCDPKSIQIDEWKNREDEGILLVENAGGTLYRLKSSSG